MIDPFLLRALAAGLGLAVVAAPLGCVVVWRRMAYFGETIATACLLGIAAGLALHADPTLAVILTALLVAGLLSALQRQTAVPADSLLGLLHHTALAAGVVATTRLRTPGVDLTGYLFGDVLAVSNVDLAGIGVGGAAVLAALAFLWDPLIRVSVHEELAAAEGVPTGRVRLAVTVLIAVTVALAMKVAGALLAIAFLVVPAVAARPWASSAGSMALIAALIAAASVLAGLALSAAYDVPAGPAIVLVMSASAAVSIVARGRY